MWHHSSIHFKLKNALQAPAIETLEIPDVNIEHTDDSTCRLTFPRDTYTTGDIIRRVVKNVDVRDILVEEESIEDIVRRVYKKGYFSPPEVR